jgi:choline kinase
MPGATTAVILGGGLGRRFGVLTSRDSPKALLPLGNAALLSYSVEWVASAGLREAIVVVGAQSVLVPAAAALTRRRAAGDAAAAAVSRWTSEEYKGACKLTVVGA